MGVETKSPLAGLSPQTTAMVAWDQPKAWLRVSTYLTDREPPRASVTCAHAVVMHTKLVVVMRRVDGSHYLPGGPIKEGESYGQALARELYDKCALSIVTTDYLGFVHFSSHGAGPEADTFPDMFHVVYGIGATGSPFLGDVDRFQEDARMVRPEQAAALVGTAYAQPFIERVTRS
jgi:ADP-ribose pyrophosphatase YjhB (NUDIX family)